MGPAWSKPLLQFPDKVTELGQKERAFLETNKVSLTQTGMSPWLI